MEEYKTHSDINEEEEEDMKGHVDGAQDDKCHSISSVCCLPGMLLYLRHYGMPNTHQA